MTGDRLSVTFWGVRGSIACPGPATAVYGGNTACLEIRAADKLLIFDAGTGLKPFGGALGKDGIAARTGLTGVAVARRTAELQRAGLIQPTGKTVLSTAGRPEREWKVA